MRATFVPGDQDCTLQPTLSSAFWRLGGTAYQTNRGLAARYGRYGYRRITVLVRREERPVNHKRVERIWRRDGPKVPPRQPKGGHLWLNVGSGVRLRPQHSQDVLSYDLTRRPISQN